MSTALATTQGAPAWRPQPGEGKRDFFAFLFWALLDGPLDKQLARAHHWTERRNAIETFEVLWRIKPGDEPITAAIARVRILLVELFKLERDALQNPDSVMSVSEVMTGVDWLLEATETWQARQANSLDWTKLDPEEREIMLHAKLIQDRLLKEVLE